MAQTLGQLSPIEPWRREYTNLITIEAERGHTVEEAHKEAIVAAGSRRGEKIFVNQKSFLLFSPLFFCLCPEQESQLTFFLKLKKRNKFAFQFISIRKKTTTTTIGTSYVGVLGTIGESGGGGQSQQD